MYTLISVNVAFILFQENETQATGHHVSIISSKQHVCYHPLTVR